MANPVPIYFFVPNLIGYARIALAFIAFYYAFDAPLVFLAAYTLSFVLDAADGVAARALNQCSLFGAILDMFTDRAATTAAIVVISHVVQPDKAGVLLAAGLCFLDVASHFVRMYVMAQLRAQSHKDTAGSIFGLLKLYYSNRNFMGLLCVGQEVSYIAYYAWFTLVASASAAAKAGAVVAPLADLTTAVQQLSAFSAYSPLEVSLRWTLLVCIPLCLLKQVVNVQQLLDALYHLSVLDATQREEAQKKRKQ